VAVVVGDEQELLAARVPEGKAVGAGEVVAPGGKQLAVLVVDDDVVLVSLVSSSRRPFLSCTIS
jgi:hypothetical protein